MRESASTDLREPQGSNPLGPPGPELLTGKNVFACEQTINSPLNPVLSKLSWSHSSD